MELKANIEKLHMETTETGVNLHVDGAPEGIHIEHEIIQSVIEFLTAAHAGRNE